MNRPRNRQPRPHQNPNNNRHNQSPRNPRPNRNTNSCNVPTIQQVTPGASVSIVQKADQPTGHEVQGVVKDVLTRGDHPMGIKVRLQDGRIGRVQRMAIANPPAANSNLVRAPQSDSTNKILGDRGSTPSLAGERDLTSSTGTAVVANCPICGDFEGDEVAVSYHVQEHLDGKIDPP